MKTITKTKTKAKPIHKITPELLAKPKAGANYKAKTKPKKEEASVVREAEPKYLVNPKEKGVWQLQEAKAMFSEVVRAAQKEPQIITVHGKETAVLLSYEEYRKDKKPKMTLFEFFRNSPFYGIELDIPPRVWEPDRDINL